jgi:SpoVK/Ycf46/Vps4 family AAA+-type ATPase
MARADILISLIKSAHSGDMVTFRRRAESLIAEEREKKHNILADRLTAALNNGSKNGVAYRSNEKGFDLLFEVIPEKQIEDLILDQRILKICNEFTEEHHRADLLRSYGVEPRNRILLAGPPGNGKTSLAEAIANSLMYPFFVVRYENIIGSFLGETALKLQKTFDYAKTRNCVLFFDEFDTIGKERGDTKETGEIKRVVSSLLLQIDRLPSYVVVITASNHPELLDKAVWRRFQVRLNMDMPDKKNIKEYIDRFKSRTEVNFNYDVNKIANKLIGYSFAEVEDFCVDILRRAVLEKKHENAKSIVADKLKQLEVRFDINKVKQNKQD